MSEFGHSYGRGKGVFIDGWGWGPFVITVERQSFLFEDSDQFGPYLVSRRHGDILATQPGPRSPFWRAHWLWKRQGREVGVDGKECIWREPKPYLFTRKGRQLILVEDGEPDGKHFCDGKEFKLGHEP